MTEPPRLLDSSREGAELAMLRAARQYRPDPRARGRLLAALGLGTFGGLSALTAGVAKAFVAQTTVAKSVIVGGVMATVAAGTATVYVAQRPAPAAERATSTRNDPGPARGRVPAGGSEVMPPEAPPPATVPVLDPAPQPAPDLHPKKLAAKARPDRRTPARPPLPVVPEAPPPASPSARLPTAAASPAAEVPLPSVAAEPSLANEIALLDGARVAHRTGHPRTALSMLDRYRASHPGGRLRAEAAVLRVQALLAAGDRMRAAREGRTFLESHGGSMLAERVRVMVHTAERETR